MSSFYNEENKLLFLLGRFNQEIANDCIGRARISSACELMPNPLKAEWISAHNSGKTIAFRFQIKNARYFLLSHPISRFRGPETISLVAKKRVFVPNLA